MHSQNTNTDINSQHKKNLCTFRKHESFSGGYTMIPNGLICDSSIPLDSRMLLIYLLSLPEKVANEKGEMVPWIMYHIHIRRQQNIGEKALNRMLAELINAGYMKRERKQGEGGRFGNYEYVLAPFKLFL